MSEQSPPPKDDPALEMFTEEGLNKYIQERNAVLADEQAADRLLNEYAKLGLYLIGPEGEKNLALISNYIQQFARGYVSAEVIKAAVLNLGPRGSNQLEWKQPAQPQPAEPAEKLAPGQLKLDSSEWAIRRASKEAILDLIKRRRAFAAQQK